jgi:hypothetical protein
MAETPTFTPEAERVLSNMLFFLTTGGWHAWGFKAADADVCLCSDLWILCCGNWLTHAEGDAAIAAGLVKYGEPDRFGRKTFAITPADWHPP